MNFTFELITIGVEVVYIVEPYVKFVSLMVITINFPFYIRVILISLF